MFDKKFSTILTAGFAAMLASVPASALDLGFDGAGSHSGAGSFTSPLGSGSGSFGNALQGSGRASLPFSPPEISQGAPSLPSLPTSAPSLPAGSASVIGNANWLSTVSGPIGSGSAGCQGAISGVLSQNGGSLNGISNSNIVGALAVPTAPTMPAIPGVPNLPSGPGVNVNGVLSSTASLSGAVDGSMPDTYLPKLPAAEAPALPVVGVPVGGTMTASGSSQASLSIGSNGLSLNHGVSGSGNFSGGASINSTVNAVLKTATATVSAAGSFSGAMGGDSLSTLPAVTTVGEGTTIPSLPSLSGSMPSLSLPGASIEVTSDANYQASAQTPTAPTPDTGSAQDAPTSTEGSPSSTQS